MVVIHNANFTDKIYVHNTGDMTSFECSGALLSESHSKLIFGMPFHRMYFTKSFIRRKMSKIFGKFMKSVV